VRRFDPVVLLAGLLFGCLSALHLVSALSGGMVPVPIGWLIPGVLIGLGVIGVASAVFRRR
jgi:hypothetical protein